VLNDRHDFFVRNPKAQRSLRVSIQTIILSYVPHVAIGVKLAGDANALVLTRASPQGGHYPISRSEATALEQIDGHKRISDILSHALFAPFSPNKEQIRARVCERMWHRASACLAGLEQIRSAAIAGHRIFDPVSVCWRA
jgi:hypothetical protein